MPISTDTLNDLHILWTFPITICSPSNHSFSYQ